MLYHDRITTQWYGGNDEINIRAAVMYWRWNQWTLKQNWMQNMLLFAVHEIRREWIPARRNEVADARKQRRIKGRVTCIWRLR